MKRTLSILLFSVALQALKRKKRFEAELSKLQATLTAVETQREALENANTNAEVLDTMKRAAGALKTRHKDLNADNAQEIMDDIAEQNDVANEISSAISNGVATPSLDEDELMEELEALQSENLDKELLFVKPIRSKLPEVPSAELSSTPKKEKTKGLHGLIRRVSRLLKTFFNYLQTIPIWTNWCSGQSK